MAEALLEIDELTKRFGGVIASDSISLCVPKGELHAIIGPNGAGKTTLIGQLAGGDSAARVAEYWQLILGPLFLLVVLYARGGIDGLLASGRRG